MSWNSLTDRQKLLDRAIEQCGVKLDNSDACLRRVMSAIGANASEASFVKQRIELCLRNAALLNKTDDFIANTEKMLDLHIFIIRKRMRIHMLEKYTQSTLTMVMAYMHLLQCYHWSTN